MRLEMVHVSGCPVMQKENDSSCGCSQLPMVLICMAAGVTALRDTQADMQVSRQPFMLGCPLLLDAQTRIVVGCACMCGQMIFRAVQLKSGNIEPNVQPLSRQTFRASDLAIFPWRLDSGENVGVILLTHARPSSRAPLARS